MALEISVCKSEMLTGYALKVVEKLFSEEGVFCFEKMRMEKRGGEGEMGAEGQMVVGAYGLMVFFEDLFCQMGKFLYFCILFSTYKY